MQFVSPLCDYVPVFERIMDFVCLRTLSNLIQVNKPTYNNYRARIIDDWLKSDDSLKKLKEIPKSGSRVFCKSTSVYQGLQYGVILDNNHMINVIATSFFGTERVILKTTQKVSIQNQQMYSTLRIIPSFWTKRNQHAYLLTIRIEEKYCIIYFEIIFYSIFDPLPHISESAFEHPELSSNYSLFYDDYGHLEVESDLNTVKCINRNVNIHDFTEHEIITIHAGEKIGQSHFTSSAYSLPTVKGNWYAVANVDGLDFIDISKPKGKRWYTLKLIKPTFKDVIIFGDYAIVIFNDVTNTLLNIRQKRTKNVCGHFYYSYLDSSKQFLLTWNKQSGNVTRYLLKDFLNF